MNSNTMSNPHMYHKPLPPPVGGPIGPPQNIPPPVPPQFRPGIPVLPSQQYIASSSQQYHPVGLNGAAINVGSLPPQSQQHQLLHPMQHSPARPVLPPGPVPQVMHMPALQESRPLLSAIPQPPRVGPPQSYLPNSGNLGAVPPSSYSFAPSAYGLPQPSNNTAAHYQPMHQINPSSIPAGEECVVPSGTESTASVTPTPPNGQQAPASTAPVTNLQPKPAAKSSSIWMEHTSAKGRRYYYNKKTKLSTWEKPLELFTAIETADATTDWKEYKSPDGRKYYYNKVTKQSKWIIPEELKLARLQIEKASHIESKMDSGNNSVTSESVPISTAETPSTVDSSSRLVSSPASAAPLTTVVAARSPVITADGLLPTTVGDSGLQSDAVDVQPPREGASGSLADSVVDATAASTGVIRSDATYVSGNEAAAPVTVLEHNVSVQPHEEADSVKGNSVTTSVTVSDEKALEEEAPVYPSKLDAKNAFKALLESASVESDWNWEQAMRVIINDKRYGALRTLGERKQAFNEYLTQRKKQDAEERRAKLKKVKDEFRRMLEECSELTSVTRWSKAVSILGEDERFQAVERSRDREDIFDEYLSELEKKERAKAAEEHKRNILEYRQFLESCDFIKASSQWRKVQDRLETDERCARLEKIYQLEIFQEYVHDLEKHEEEQRKMQKEEIRKAERKNRDEFRKLMDEYVAAGTLTAKSIWRDFHFKVKDEPAYLAVSSNITGCTPKELFEDVLEELQKQFQEDKTKIKDALKSEKIVIGSTWKLRDMKDAIEKEISSESISESNLILVFDELLQRAREKEEKETKRRKRLGDEFFNLLCSFKDITEDSTWEEALPLFEHSEEYKSTGDENFLRQIFNEYTGQLKEKYERKRKEEKARKEKAREKEKSAKERKEKDRRHERNSSRRDHTDDANELSVSSDSKRRGKEKDKKHHRSNQDVVDETASDRNGKEHSRSSHRHCGDRKKLREDRDTPDSDKEDRRKRHKREHRNGSQKRAGSDELEDGEVGIV